MEPPEDTDENNFQTDARDDMWEMQPTRDTQDLQDAQDTRDTRDMWDMQGDTQDTQDIWFQEIETRKTKDVQDEWNSYTFQNKSAKQTIRVKKTTRNNKYVEWVKGLDDAPRPGVQESTRNVKYVQWVKNLVRSNYRIPMGITLCVVGIAAMTFALIPILSDGGPSAVARSPTSNMTLPLRPPPPPSPSPPYSPPPPLNPGEMYMVNVTFTFDFNSITPRRQLQVDNDAAAFDWDNDIYHPFNASSRLHDKLSPILDAENITLFEVIKLRSLYYKVVISVETARKTVVTIFVQSIEFQEALMKEIPNIQVRIQSNEVITYITKAD